MSSPLTKEQPANHTRPAPSSGNRPPPPSTTTIHGMNIFWDLLFCPCSNRMSFQRDCCTRQTHIPILHTPPQPCVLIVIIIIISVDSVIKIISIRMSSSSASYSPHLPHRIIYRYKHGCHIMNIDRDTSGRSIISPSRQR